MFLTLEDPRAKIQGSRDPLGVQPVWSRFGRHLVTNLTTVTTSVRGFSTLLLGRYFGERLVKEGAAGEHEALSIFLRMEQMAAYARHLGGDETGEILGVQRVRRFLDEVGSKVSIQTDPSGLILSDQKTTGLWGLYSVSARASGMLADGPVGLTPVARRFVAEHYAPKLTNHERSLRSLLLKGGTLDTRKTNPLFKALLSIFRPTLSQGERAFFGETLRDGLHVADRDRPDRQATLTRLLKQHTDLLSWIGREDIIAVANAARSIDEGLALALDRVARLEAMLALADALFQLLQTRNNQRLTDVAAAVRDLWGDHVPRLNQSSFLDLVGEIEEVASHEMAALMSRCDGALATGEYEDALRTLLDWNKLVMDARQAAPWVRLTGNRLDVRYRAVEDRMPDADELTTLWRNSYFLDSLKAITLQLEAS